MECSNDSESTMFSLEKELVFETGKCRGALRGKQDSLLSHTSGFVICSEMLSIATTRSVESELSVVSMFPSMSSVVLSIASLLMITSTILFVIARRFLF